MILSIINKFKQNLNSEDNKRLFFNFLFLSLLQGANYIFPLITLPYLVRVLGVEYFGLISFANATIAYFNILTDYGFNLSATKEVSIHRNDKNKLNEIFSSVITVKVILMILSFILLNLLIFSFKKFSSEWLIYYYTFGIVMGQMLFPVWFFQGMEKMKQITYLNILSKAIFTIAIFIFVKKKSDYFLVPLLNSAGMIIAGIISLIVILKFFKIRFSFQSKKTIFSYLQNGWHFFISNVAINLYTISTTFILGLFTNNIIVGYFAAADKLISAIKSMITPITQTLYPFISKKASESKEKGLIIAKKVLVYIGFISFAISLTVFIFSKLIINIIFGKDYINSLIVFRIMSILPFFVSLNNVFGIQIMLPQGRKKAFSNILVSASILNIALSCILVPYFKHIGSAISVLIVELFVILAMFAYNETHGLSLLKLNKQRGSNG